jgi:DNA-binding transcriptional regulator YhcF (GntR family)
MVIIEIDTADAEAVYEQIVRQVHDAVASGQLSAGAPLPTVRQLADDLALNRNTVARAYKQLEDQGILATAGRKGTFVRANAALEVVRLTEGRAERLLRDTVARLLADGFDRPGIAEMFARALDSRSEGPGS